MLNLGMDQETLVFQQTHLWWTLIYIYSNKFAQLTNGMTSKMFHLYDGRGTYSGACQDFNGRRQSRHPKTHQSWNHSPSLIRESFHRPWRPQIIYRYPGCTERRRPTLHPHICIMEGKPLWIYQENFDFSWIS